MRQRRDPFRELDAFSAVRSWVDCTTNMSGFDLRQAQARIWLGFRPGVRLGAHLRRILSIKNRGRTMKQAALRPESYTKKVALVLQGGGALGSYQAGVYEALASSDYKPDWVAGISIGAINAALIAGNSPERRVEKLREFWEAVSDSPLSTPYLRSIQY